MYAKLLSKKAEEMEPGITKDLKDLELDGIGKLVSLEHRKKPITSIIEKIIADSKSERYKGSYKRAADNICDTVRYTFIISDDMYTKKLDECLHMLEDMGYEEKQFRIGGRRDKDSMEYYWVDEYNVLYGDQINTSVYWCTDKWMQNEPSFVDGEIDECYLDIFYYEGEGRWVMNDVPNDIISIVPYYSGKIGYIIEYEN